MALYEISDREIATILGSLRATQNVQQHEALAPQIAEIMDGGGEFAPLDDGEVDALCEDLNLGGFTASEAANKLILGMSGLIEEAIESHIYQEGDEVPDDCPYHAAVQDAEAFVNGCSDFSPPPIGALEVMADLSAACSALGGEVEQLKGLAHPSYTDEDGATQQALDDGDEAVKRADLYRKGVDAGPIQLFVKVEGGNVQDVTCSRDLPGVEVIVIDFDVQDEDQAVVEVHMEGDRWEEARADPFSITIEPAPITREIAEEEEQPE